MAHVRYVYKNLQFWPILLFYKKRREFISRNSFNRLYALSSTGFLVILATLPLSTTLSDLKAKAILDFVIMSAISFPVPILVRPIHVMAIRVVKFSNGGYKIRKVFAWESTYSKEIIEFWELD